MYRTSAHRPIRVVALLAGVMLTLGSATLTGNAHAKGWDWAGVASFQAFTGEGYPEGYVENDIQLDVIHVKINADLSDHFYVTLHPCYTHTGSSFSIIQGFLGISALQMLNFEIGRVLVPFGRVNYMAEPNNQPTLSRPYMYMSHCIPNLPMRANFARPLAGTFWSDLGIVWYGSLWPSDFTQLWFSAWVGNGQFGSNDVEWQQPWRPFSDNNDSKSYGARIVFTQEILGTKGPDAMLSFGGSFTGGKYDDWDELYDWAAGADLQFDVGSFTLQAEYIHRSTNFWGTNSQDPAETVFDNYETQAFYAFAKIGLPKKLSFISLVARVEGMWRIGPDWVGSSFAALDPDDLADRTNRLMRYTFGIPMQLNAWIAVKPEFWYADYEHDLKGDFVALEILEDADRDVYRIGVGIDVAF